MENKQNKKRLVYGLLSGLVLIGGGVMFATLNQPKPVNMVKETVVAVKETQKVNEPTKVEETTSVTPEQAKQEQTQEQQAPQEPVQEQAQGQTQTNAQEQATPVAQAQPQANTHASANANVQPAQEQPKPQPQQPQPQPQTTTVAQPKPQNNQDGQVIGQVQAPPKRTASSSKTIVMGGIGDSGREFATYEEAYAWGQLQLETTSKSRFAVMPVVYSDDTITYTVDFS